MTAREEVPARAGSDWTLDADVLDLLARIHDREIDGAFVAGWRDSGISTWLPAVVSGADARAAANDLAAAVDAMPDPVDAASLDELAVVFADLYLTHGYRISPNGSVWLTDENLERQGPMFETRNWYRRYGLEVPDWRKRPDDNLVYQVQFLALLLRRGGEPALSDAARFLDSGLLIWLPEYARRAEARVHAPLYRAAARLTLALVDGIRDRIEALTGLERDVPDLERKSCPATPAPTEAPYVPGQAESW
ncbi:hypothetical protein CSC94_15385 [Zhengella mangrovi]|uniref:Dehydrogenase n=1 Tax=Zhengella mangrovi TaxID=1982044 RepID=A0A2G1QLA9_9HYPH|nr:molecular chaperone TorD family protein [Zhengella mangrovi]PHP66306.1 hypothetical protein CSC94_15385 [Zhengella mangrovi]